MAVNKVVYGNQTVIDISDTTAVASDVMAGKYFYGNDGVKTLGTGSSGGGITINDVPNATGITAEIISGGVTPSETWETLYENANTGYYYDQDNTYPYCWISTLGNTSITAGSVWRITFDGDVYRCTATYDSVMGGFYFIGNPKYSGGTDDGSDVPFCFYNTGFGAWSGSADKLNVPDITQTVSIKVERLVTS